MTAILQKNTDSSLGQNKSLMRYDRLSAEIPTLCCWNNCGLVYASSRLALNHLRQEHGLKETNGKCLWNDCKFETSALVVDIHNHVKRHFDVVEAVCEVCRKVKTFKWRFDLQKHLRYAHKYEDFKVIKKEIDGFDVSIAKPIAARELPCFLQKIINLN